MSDTISTYLNKIKNAKYGNEVLEAICGGLEECYSDVTSSSLKLQAFKTAIQELSESGAFTGLTLGDGSVTGSKLADGSVTKNKLDPSVTFGLDVDTKKALLDLLAKVDYTSENGKLLYRRLKSLLEMESFPKNKILEIEYSADDYANKYLTDKVSGHNFSAKNSTDSSVIVQCRYYNTQDAFDLGVGAKGLTIVSVCTKHKGNSSLYNEAHAPLYLNTFYANNTWDNFGVGLDNIFAYSRTDGSFNGSGFFSWKNTPPVIFQQNQKIEKYVSVPYTTILSIGIDGSITVWINGNKIAEGSFPDFKTFSTVTGMFVYASNNNADTGGKFYMKAGNFFKSLIMYEGVFTDSEASAVNDFFVQ